MKLDHTVIIPSDNYSIAKKLFTSLIYDEDVLVLIVLGNDDISTNAVQCADKRAKVVIQGFERKVGWILTREILEKEIKELKAGKEDIANKDLSKVVAFSVSLDNKVAKIFLNGDEINFLTMDMAFLKAGSS